MAYHTTKPRLPLLWASAAVVVGSVVGYTLAVNPVVHSLEQVLYPIIWLGASAVSLWVVRERLSQLTPGVLSVGAAYTLVLLWTAGLLGQAAGPAGLSVHLALPGWGPAIVYTGSVLSVVVVPFLFVGYVTLGVLAASALRATLRTTAAGAFGLLACVSCTAPLLAGIAGSLGAGPVAATVSAAQYPLATAAFALSMGGLTLVSKSV